MIHLAALVLALDPYLLSQDAIDRGAYRTAMVLLQELSYRSKDSPSVRSFFKNIRLPSRLSEPNYTYGYLWPHELRQLDEPPYQAMSKRVIREHRLPRSTAVELAPFWCLMTASGECIAALSLPGQTRSLDIGDGRQTSSQPHQEDFYEEVSALAGGWQCPRLAAGLALDVIDRKDSSLLGRLRATPYLQSLLDQRLPPGCDMYNSSWEAFSGAIRGTLRSTEVSFAELFERGMVLSAARTSDPDRGRVRVIRGLESPAGSVAFEAKPLRECVVELCKTTGVVDRTDWTALRQHVNPETPVSLERRRVPLRVVIQTAIFVAGRDRLRLLILDDGIAITWDSE